MMKVIISAAGTGGHINPGIAIANKIKDSYKIYENGITVKKQQYHGPGNS